MDFKGQTALLSAVLVLVGMVFLVPAITEKALAGISASATGTCGPEGQTHPCHFTLEGKTLDKGSWTSKPTQSGTLVTWSTTGVTETPAPGMAHSVMWKVPGNEKGSVTYKVGYETAVLSFDNPLIGSNKCSVSGIEGSCTAGKGMNADFTYNLRGGIYTPQQEQESQTALLKQDCMQLKATMANDEAAAAQYKSKDCESLLK